MNRCFLPDSRIIVIVCVSVVFGPAAEPLLFRQKEPKPLTPRPASFNETDARHGRASQLAALKQGSPDHVARPLRGPGGRRRTLGDEDFRDPDEKARNHIFRMIVSFSNFMLSIVVAVIFAECLV